MDVCKYTVSYQLGGTLNNRTSNVTSPLVVLVAGEERWKALLLPIRGVFPQNWGGNEPNRTVTCMPPTSAGLSNGRTGAWGLNKLDLTKCSRYKFRSTRAKWAGRSSGPEMSLNRPCL
ncbi:hypothetical protein TNCV_1665821 [Trichonephila clavipes]|nr:hypothetical protein TNCV_1665821 [Trichonephila clavipes]